MDPAPRPSPPRGAPRGPRALRAAAVVAVAMLALALRWHPPREEVLYPDAAVYMRQAQGYLDGQPSIAPPWRQLPAGGPVYPALTALLAPLAGDVERAGVWISRAAGVTLAAAATGLGWALAGPVAGLAAGALTAVEPRLVHFSETDLTESLFYLLLLAALAAAWRAARPGAPGAAPSGWRAEFAAGALLGVVALTRAVGLAALPAVVAAVLAGGLLPGRAPWPRVFTRAVRIAAGGLLVLGLYQGVAWSHGWTTAFDTHTPRLFTAAPGARAGPAPDAGGAEPTLAVAERGLARAGQTLTEQVRTVGGMLPPLVWVLALLGLGVRLRGWRRPGFGADLLLLGTVAAYLATLALFRTHLPRYLVALFPVLFLYAGFGLAAVWGLAARLAGRFCPHPAWVGSAAAWGLVLAAGAVATEQTRTVFTVPERAYAEVRGLARDVAGASPLAAPLAVYADHAFYPYYAGGYWLGPAAPPDTTGRLGAGSRVVVLDSAHADRWPVAWIAPALERRDVGPFRLADQRYFPRHGQILTVYVDAPPGPGAPPAPGDGLNLLRAGRFAEAARAFAREGPTPAARRGLGVMEMVAGQFFPERLARAREDLAEAPGAPAPVPAADPAPTGPPVPWRWSLPPGELLVGLDDASAAWNRAAVALALGDPAAALGEVPALARTFGPAPRNQYLTGLVLLGLGHAREALQLLGPALQGLPDDPGVAVAWANAMALEGGYGQAVPVYRRVLKRDPGNPGVWLNLIQAELGAGDLAGAGDAIAACAGLALEPAQRERLAALTRERERRLAAGAEGKTAGP